MRFEPISPELELVGKLIVDSVYTVHKNLGPGLLEKIYEVCFCHELNKRNVKFERQKEISILYDGLIFKEGLRLDVLVENQIICELKVVDLVKSYMGGSTFNLFEIDG